MVVEFIKVVTAQKDAFWQLYGEYETALRELGKQRVELLEKYADNFDKLTNESMDKMMTETISLQKKSDNLLISFTNKVKKATSSIVALPVKS